MNLYSKTVTPNESKNHEKFLYDDNASDSITDKDKLTLYDNMITFSVGIGKTVNEADKALMRIKEKENHYGAYNISFWEPSENVKSDDFSNPENAANFSNYLGLFSKEELKRALEAYLLINSSPSSDSDSDTYSYFKNYIIDSLTDSNTHLKNRVGMAYDYIANFGISENLIDVGKEVMSEEKANFNISDLEKLVDKNKKYNENSINGDNHEATGVYSYFLYLDGNGLHDLNEKEGHDYVTELLKVAGKSLYSSIRTRSSRDERGNHRKDNLELSDLIIPANELKSPKTIDSTVRNLKLSTTATRVHGSAGDEYVIVLYSKQKLNRGQLTGIAGRILNNIYIAEQEFITKKYPEKIDSQYSKESDESDNPSITDFPYGMDMIISEKEAI
ncbi:MAG: hypothetical protein GWP09_01515 [Nitrospiraceae bacterium]|nr:hypothetical protein [Nitrospiraceae bacterium]